VIALSDAGARLVYLCDAGFGLYFLGHWVRERGAFDLTEGKNAACTADGAPFVAMVLAARLRLGFGEDSPHPAQLATAFLDNAKDCPGAQGIAAITRAELMELAKKQASPAAATR
jgi:N-acyl-D-amino-acid deacylase